MKQGEMKEKLENFYKDEFKRELTVQPDLPLPTSKLAEALDDLILEVYFFGVNDPKHGSTLEGTKIIQRLNSEQRYIDCDLPLITTDID